MGSHAFGVHDPSSWPGGDVFYFDLYYFVGGLFCHTCGCLRGMCFLDGGGWYFMIRLGVSISPCSAD